MKYRKYWFLDCIPLNSILSTQWISKLHSSTNAVDDIAYVGDTVRVDY